MKKLKLILIYCFAFFIYHNNYAQQSNYTGHVLLLRKTKTMVYLGSGSSILNSDVQNLGVMKPISFNIGLNHTFWKNNKLGLGFHAFAENSSGNGTLKSVAALPIIGYTSNLNPTTTPKYSGFAAGVGPQLNFALSDKLLFSPILDFAFVNQKLDAYTISQKTTLGREVQTFNLFSQSEVKSSGLGIIPRIRLHYFVTKNIGLWAEGKYSILPNISATTTSLIPNGSPNKEGFYNYTQINNGKNNITELSINNSAFGFGGGIVFGFGNGKSNQPSTQTTVSTTYQERPKTKETQILENIKPNANGEIFTAHPIKKETAIQNNCVKIMSPINGSNQKSNNSINVLLKTDGLMDNNIDVKIYKISNDANYWFKTENLNDLVNTENTVFLSSKFEKESKSTGFPSITVHVKQRGAFLESSIDKGQLNDGSYKLVAISNCGVTSSNFSINGASCGTNDAMVNASCKGWVNGLPTYNVSVVFNNVSSSTQSCTTKMTGVVSSTGNISSVSTFPTVIPINGNSATVNFIYTPNMAGATNADFVFMGNWNDALNNSSNFAKTIILPNCICDFCDKVLEFDNDDSPNATYNATNNSISIHQVWWNMNYPAATVVNSKAEIIGFEREVSDDCMKCDKDPSQWGNFISGHQGNSNGFFGSAMGSITGNTHHTMYFVNPNSTSFDLNISLPPMSTLACCCEKIKCRIRYTYTFKDKNGECKMCSSVFEYYYQRGDCPVINPGGGVGTGKGTGTAVNAGGYLDSSNTHNKEN